LSAQDLHNIALPLYGEALIAVTLAASVVASKIHGDRQKRQRPDGRPESRD
jgi:hypothetical protein